MGVVPAVVLVCKLTDLEKINVLRELAASIKFAGSHVINV